MKSQGNQQKEFRGKLKWLMALRVMIVTLLLGTSIILQVGYGKALPSVTIFSFLIASTYFLTIIYSLLINHIRKLHGFAYLQLVLDLALLTALIYYTGGIDSPFSPFYMITILSASVILDRRGSVLTAALAGILFGIIVDLQFFGLMPGLPKSPYGGLETLYLLFLNMVAFVTVAYLTGSLAEKLKQTRKHLVEKSIGLADLQAFHENVVRSISSGVLTTDVEGRITSLNRAAQEITGYATDEVRGRPWWWLFMAEHLKTLIARDKPLMGSFRMNLECRRKGGAPLFLGMTATALRDGDGRMNGSVLAFQDLTRIREMEEEVKRKKWLAAVGEMAAGIAHEIRNPLASISGAMQVLKKEKALDQENKHLMTIALNETDRLNSIVTSFLFYARPAQLNKKQCDLHVLLSETLDLLQKSSDFRAGVKVHSRFANQKIRVDVDLDQMKQVFWNLAINAVQAMPDGGELDVTTQRVIPKRRTDQEDPTRRSWVRIGFKDSGDGISEENRDKIFYPFFTTKDKGSGLGLSIVHRIIEDHGGRIHVQSQVLAGTTVSVFLPIIDDSMALTREEELRV
jgi:two-component system, NtrC family, sensor histidine kinase PilS